ncbi:MAG: hypothetical protein ABJR05_03675 [Balneola sp.]
MIDKKISNFTKVFILIFLFALIIKILEATVAIPVIKAAYNGDSFDYLNDLLQKHKLRNPTVRNLAFYSNEVSSYINRFILLFSGSLFLIFLIVRNNYKKAKDFFNAPESSFKVDILRIVIFGFLLYINFPNTINDLLSNPNTSTFSIPGWSKGLIDLILTNPIPQLLGIAFTVFCFGALIGIFTRKMIIGAVITGFFIMGIPQFFGKINHYHFLWHVILILSFARPGISLSVDSYLKNKSFKHSEYLRINSLAIKFIMIIIGLIYFFPGFWKIVFSGSEWIFSENLKFRMHSNWIVRDGWLPFFRVDHYPFLYQSAAFFTILIELGFIFALFFKKIRPYFVLGAFFFHLSVFFLLNISFVGLMIIYLIFIDWDKILNLSPKNYPKTLKKSSKKLQYVALLVIGFNILTGFTLINSWPFSVYPTFASVETNSTPSILVQEIDTNKNVIKEVIPLLDENYINEFVSQTRLSGFILQTLTSKTKKQDGISILKNIYRDSYSSKIPDSLLKVYKIRLSTNPDLPNRQKILERKLIEN